LLAKLIAFRRTITFSAENDIWEIPSKEIVYLDLLKEETNNLKQIINKYQKQNIDKSILNYLDFFEDKITYFKNELEPLINLKNKAAWVQLKGILNSIYNLQNMITNAIDNYGAIENETKDCIITSLNQYVREFNKLNDNIKIFKEKIVLPDVEITQNNVKSTRTYRTLYPTKDEEDEFPTFFKLLNNFNSKSTSPIVTDSPKVTHRKVLGTPKKTVRRSRSEEYFNSNQNKKFNKDLL